MRYEFALPDLGEGMTEAEIVRWLVPLGGAVAQDQPVVELQTDKAVIEIPSPAAGVLLEQGGSPGDVLRVGSVLLVLETAASGAPPAAETAATGPGPAEVAVTAAPVWPPEQIPRAAPAVRRRARELGVDLRRVRGSGPAGRITMADLQAAAPAAPAPASPPAAVAAPAPQPALAAEPEQAGAADFIPLRGLRRTIADRLERSAQVPAFTVLDEADVTELVLLRQRLQATLGQKLTFLPFVVRAVAQAVAAYPSVNGHFDAERRGFVPGSACHIGIATATEQGLLVPVLRDAGRKSVLELAAELAQLAAAAREQRLAREQLTGSTFSISNFGALGSMSGTPMLNPPEVAILGTGRIDRLPRYDAAGQLVPREIMHLALTVDHRVIDGDTAVGFLNRLKAFLQEPGLLLVHLH